MKPSSPQNTMIDKKDTIPQADISPGMSIIHGNHMEDLRQIAIEWIGNYPLGPLENETFIVQSNGMAQWLKLALAGNEGCGISAAVTMQLPARFLWNAYRAVLGEEGIPDQSPYDKDRLVWRLLRLLPALTEKEWFAPLKRYLADDSNMLKRYQLACQLADLYDQYQVYRADWLANWTAGGDRLRNALRKPMDIPPDQRWQAKLWRYVYKDIPEPQQNAGRFKSHRLFLEAVERASQRPNGLPRRVIVFGISSLPGQTLQTIHAVSRLSQVLVFAHNPCRHYWADIVEDRELLRIEHARHKRKEKTFKDLNPEQLHQHVNPLLASWGKQGRDYIGLLYGYDQPEAYRKQFGEIDLFRDFVTTDPPDSLLAQVQQAILDLTPLPTAGEPKQSISQDDRSIAFVQSHSRQREVEILQDQLLSLFDLDPELNPQDVIVMTPDIEAYSPHIDAVFGRFSDHDPRHLPYMIADRSAPHGIATFQALETLLQLPSLRIAAGELMGLLSVPAFRERFGIKQTDFPLLQQWLTGSGIRWGLHACHRKSFGLPEGIEQNTWKFGLQRMLLGYATGDGDSWKGIEPFDEIGGLDAAQAGSLSAIVEKLETYWNRFGQPASPEKWVRRISGLMNDFFLPTENSDTLILNHFSEVLEKWLGACNDSGFSEALPLPVVREALLKEMKQSGLSQRFFAGKINFCTMMPMRAIPFQIVCLLGMNDGEYPRSVQPFIFDLMSVPGNYRPGDRSRREDDRYLFLEAMLSARKQLYISSIGSSVQDNSERMPSVLVSQLRDYLEAGWRTEQPVQEKKSSNNPLLDQLTFRHPLQPFSPTYFQPGEWPRRFTYAHEWENVFEQQETTVDESPLEPANTAKSIPLHLPTQFLKNPIKAFFNQRLNVYFNEVDTIIDNQEPFALDALASFGPGRRLLKAGLAADRDCRTDAVFQAADRLRRTGELPLFGFGRLSAEALVEPIRNMLDHHDELLSAWSEETITVEIDLPVQLEISVCEKVEDWLDGLRLQRFQVPDKKKSPRYARWEFYPLPIMGKNRRIFRFHPFVGPWVKHLAACAQGFDLTTYLVAPDRITDISPIDRSSATKWLNDILFHWATGLERPLPVTARTALAYLSSKVENTFDKARKAAKKAYEGDGFNYPGELGYGDGAYLRRFYPTFDSLWRAGDNEFETLADTLYDPIFGAVTT